MCGGKQILWLLPFEFRLGSSQSNKLDVVRNRDIAEMDFYRHQGVDSKTPTNRPGEVRRVKGDSGGKISLFDDMETASISGKFWCRVPAGVDIPGGLGLIDSKKHPGKATH